MNIFMLRPVRPAHSIDPEAEKLFGPEDEAPGAFDDWGEVLAVADHEDSGKDGDHKDMVCKPCGVSIDAADGSWEPVQLAQRPVPLTDVKMPSAAEIARHNLDHLPFRRWCIWCRAARTPHPQHRALPGFSRAIPLLVFDDCFLGELLRPGFGDRSGRKDLPLPGDVRSGLRHQG